MDDKCNEQLVLMKASRDANVFSALLFCALFLASAAGQQQPHELHQFLNNVGFSHDQILQVDHGAIAVKVLKPGKHEVAVIAVVRVHVPQEFFVARIRDIERHKKSEAVLQVRKFSNPMKPEDLAGMKLVPQEIQDLRSCHPGHCRFKLSTQQMELVHNQLNFSAPTIEQDANLFMRSLLANYVREYEANGNKAMIVYADKDRAVESAAQFAELIYRSSNVLAYAPELRDYLLNFPNTKLEGVERFLYWSRENYGHNLQPVLAITDLVMYRCPDRNPPVLIASKQIYATHYLEASLGLTMLFERNETDPVPSFYLIYVNRSRIDLLRRWYSVFARGSVSDSARNSIRKAVSELRNKVEAEFRTAQEKPVTTRLPARTQPKRNDQEQIGAGRKRSTTGQDRAK